MQATAGAPLTARAERQAAADRANRHRRRTPAAVHVAVARTATRQVPKPARHKPTSQSRAQRVIRYALAQRGDPYIWGAAGPNAFDCSGLIVAAYRQVGIRLPHFTGALLGYGRRISRAAMRPGDLVFTSSHHVGLYLGRGRMVVAPHSGAVVRIQTVYAFYTARRIL